MRGKQGCVSVLELLAYAVGFDATTPFNECQIFIHRLRVLFQLSAVRPLHTFPLSLVSVVELMREPATESWRLTETRRDSQNSTSHQRPWMALTLLDTQ